MNSMGPLPSDYGHLVQTLEAKNPASQATRIYHLVMSLFFSPESLLLGAISRGDVTSTTHLMANYNISELTGLSSSQLNTAMLKAMETGNTLGLVYLVLHIDNFTPENATQIVKYVIETRPGLFEKHPSVLLFLITMGAELESPGILQSFSDPSLIMAYGERATQFSDTLYSAVMAHIDHAPAVVLNRALGHTFSMNLSDEERAQAVALLIQKGADPTKVLVTPDKTVLQEAFFRKKPSLLLPLFLYMKEPPNELIQMHLRSNLLTEAIRNNDAPLIMRFATFLPEFPPALVRWLSENKNEAYDLMKDNPELFEKIYTFIPDWLDSDILQTAIRDNKAPFIMKYAAMVQRFPQELVDWLVVNLDLAYQLIGNNPELSMKIAESLPGWRGTKPPVKKASNLDQFVTDLGQGKKAKALIFSMAEKMIKQRRLDLLKEMSDKGYINLSKMEDRGPALLSLLVGSDVSDRAGGKANPLYLELLGRMAQDVLSLIAARLEGLDLQDWAAKKQKPETLAFLNAIFGKPK